MKPFSFVHVADLHLGYVEYNLDVRREDFNAAFQEVVDKTIELKLNLLCIIRLP
ncbi:MAG: DNA double-strand break repair protein Mre11 [Candidatus Bathyarchaeota archaeon BA2]|nr:MAG: DNA double-strand break repair protein Mre11 [Candidatus Bathyarchaeota archaeon BA2]